MNDDRTTEALEILKDLNKSNPQVYEVALALSTNVEEFNKFESNPTYYLRGKIDLLPMNFYAYYVDRDNLLSSEIQELAFYFPVLSKGGFGFCVVCQRCDD